MASIERTAYPRFRHTPHARELAEYFTPTEDEIAFGQELVRRDTHFFAIMLLLKCAQYLGYFPALAEVPPAIVNHVRICLRLPMHLIPTTDQPRTLRRHHSAIRDHLGLKPSHSCEARRMAVHAVVDAAQVMANPADLINVAVDHLRRHTCELPSFPTLDRMVQRVRNVVHGRLFAQLMGQLPPAAIACLDRLLATTELGERHTTFQHLKDAPKKPSLTHLDLLLEHLEWLESLGDVESPLHGMAPALVQHFAAEAKTLYAGELREMRAPKRYTLLLCLIQQMRVRTRDDVVEMFLKRMATIHKQARQKLVAIQTRQREKTENLVAALAGMLDVVGTEASETAKIRRIERVVAERGGLTRLREDCDAIQAWSHNNYFPLLIGPFRRHRALLFRLVHTLHLESTTQDHSLLTALTSVMVHQDRRAEWAPADEIDLTFASERWHALVCRTRHGQREMHRRPLEICVFTHLALDLKAGDLAVIGSEHYADYRAQLVPWEKCTQLLEGYCAQVGLPATAHAFVQQLRRELESTAEAADTGYPENTALTITTQGEPVLKRPPAKQQPVSVLELEAAVQTRLPERSMLDVLWLVERAVHYTRHFGPLSGFDAKLEHLEERYCLTLFAMGSGMGVSQAARHMRGLISAPTLSLINRRHITGEKLEAAARDILDTYSQFQLPRYWGSGKTAAFDGTLFELAEQNLLADFHFRYRLKGAVAFHVISDLYIALFTHFIPPGVWEAVYIIEALMQNRSKIQPDTVFADTQGQSTPVFAFTHLLGIQLMPRIRNWKDLRFYRPAPDVHYRHIEALFTDTIDWELIETHWQDFMQVTLSIYTGRISSAMLLRKLGHWSRKNRLYLAAQEVGRVKRTIYLLRWISDAALRSGVTAGTNSVEGYHALTKWMQFGGEGIITENDPDEQQKRARYLGLLTSALIFWNVAEMTRVIGDLVEEGYAVQQEDLAFLSPYLTRHIKRFGDYTLHTELTPGPIEYALDLARQRPASAIQITLPFLQEV
jgi:TnpA family transposase